MTARPVRIQIEPLDVSLAHRPADEALCIARGLVQPSRPGVWRTWREAVRALLWAVAVIVVFAGGWLLLNTVEGWLR